MTVTPVVHLNGTSQTQLLEGYLTAMQAVHGAVVALCKAAPHGRDYYPLGDQAIVTAVQEHHDRLRRLDEIFRELESIARAVSEQGPRA